MSLLSNLPINRIGMIMCICMLWVYWLFMYSNAAYLHLEWLTHSRWNHLTVHSGSLQRIIFSVDGISHVHNLYWSPTSHTPGSRIKTSSKAVRKSKSSPTKYSSLLYTPPFLSIAAYVYFQQCISRALCHSVSGVRFTSCAVRVGD